MTRAQMVEILINDKIHEFVCCQNTDGLEDLLCEGWEGFANWPTKDLKEEVKTVFEDYEVNFPSLTKKEIQKMISLKRAESICALCDE